jgi:hypothetical protein
MNDPENLIALSEGMLAKVYALGYDAAKTKTAEQTFSVIVSAPGWRGHFTIPQSCFDELTKFLARHACAERSPDQAA